MLSYTIVQQPGGAGGNTTTCEPQSSGGLENSGNGGGGATMGGTSGGNCLYGAWGTPATATQGGFGAASTGSCSPTPGAGAMLYGMRGGDGSSAGCVPYGTQCSGGGGGSRGLHGQGLYIAVRGHIYGAGKIDVSGQVGGAGGTGGSCTGFNSGNNVFNTGGGGGSGAGGDGGAIVFRYGLDLPTNLTMLVGGGPPGAGGMPGSAGAYAITSQPGKPGTRGLDGILDVKPLPY
jgi:hypothetical protein